jgi:non-ribosomal peptide synthetase component F
MVPSNSRLGGNPTWQLLIARQVYFGGEPVSDAIVRRWWSPGQRELYNIYGSTEVR